MRITHGVGKCAAVWLIGGCSRCEQGSSQIPSRASRTCAGGHSRLTILTPDALELARRPLVDVIEKVKAERRTQAWAHDQRRSAVATDVAMRERNAAAADAGQPPEHHFSKLYLPHEGMFCEPPADLQLGTRLPVRACLPPVAAAAPTAALQRSRVSKLSLASPCTDRKATAQAREGQTTKKARQCAAEAL